MLRNPEGPGLGLLRRHTNNKIEHSGQPSADGLRIGGKPGHILENQALLDDVGRQSHEEHGPDALTSAASSLSVSHSRLVGTTSRKAVPTLKANWATQHRILDHEPSCACMLGLDHQPSNQA